eukprot:CAMPEP_0183829060 /NCGR_PEP_ID=MMETSP0807_2-20130328/3112_1 /TAXON_ID=88271 /ORGANISM="Picocystis salinarum, Strain CCMP1897" /LENGTH=755 /DNA_ID=CAMNT_0026074267 /DNA_START=29 /DNA_END=2296 /DNA_ORIENTATION=+
MATSTQDGVQNMQLEQIVSRSRMEAVDALARLIPSATQMGSLQELRKQYDAYAQTNGTKLAEVSATRTSEMVGVVKGVEEAVESVQFIDSTLRNIRYLTEDCQGLITSKQTVHELSIVRRNLEKVIEHVEVVSSVESRAQKVQEMLRNPSNFVKAYEKLAALEADIASLLSAVAKDAKDPQQGVEALEAFFVKVGKTNTIVEDHLWHICDDIVSLCENRPFEVVEYAKVIQCQEIIEEKRRSNKVQFTEKRWRDKFIKRLQSRAKQKFQSMIEQADSGTLPPTDICSELTDKLVGLVNYYDIVKPCFPPNFMIFEAVQKTYHEQITAVIGILGKQYRDLSNTEIIEILSFVESYQDLMQTLDVSERDLWIPVHSAENVEGKVTFGVRFLLAEYRKRLLNSLKSWNMKLMELELSDPPKQRNTGKYWSPTMVDMFHSVNEQINTVTTAGNGALKIFVTETCLGSILIFQILYKEGIRGLPAKDALYLQRMSACINNGLSAHDMAEELSESLDESIDERYHGILSVEDVCRGFLDVCNVAVDATVQHIFRDPGFKKLLQQLFDKSWAKGQVTASVVLTLKDYLYELRDYIEPSYFKRLCERCMQELCQVYTEYLLVNATALLGEHKLGRLEKDHASFVQFFSEMVQAKRVKVAFQLIQDFIALASAPSIERFNLSYTLLLKNQAWFPSDLAERIVMQRFDGQMLEAQQGIKQLHEQWEKEGSRQQLPRKGAHRRLRSLNFQFPDRQAPGSQSSSEAI